MMVKFDIFNQSETIATTLYCLHSFGYSMLKTLGLAFYGKKIL